MRYIIGIGGAGGVLASQAYKKIQKAKINDVILLNFSTSLEDALNISEVQQTLQVIQEGAGKNFSAGEQMWEKNFPKITKYLEPISAEDDVFIFASTAGGSGSSGMKFFINYFFEKKVKSIVVNCLLPSEESLNFKTNCFLSLNELANLDKKATILLFDNKELFKNFKNDLFITNDWITDKVIYTFFLKDLDKKERTIWTLDKNDFREIIYKPGFLNSISLKEFDFTTKKINFETYGSINQAKRILLIYNLTPKDNLERVAQVFQDNIQKFIGKFAKNTVIHYGIVETNFLPHFYHIFANEISINNLLFTLKVQVSNSLEKFKALGEKAENVLSKDEKKQLDLRKFL